MQCKLHASSGDVYVSTRKVGSQLLDSLDLQDLWIDSKNADQYAKIFAITRCPTDRFLSMYSFLQSIYHNNHPVWDVDAVYRECFNAAQYLRFFANPRWQELAAVEDFAEHALPVLSRTRDLHWRTQCSRLRQVGITTPVTIPLQHVNRWMFNRYGWTISKVNHVSWQLKGTKQLFARAIDPILREGIWKEDYVLYQS